MTRSVCVQCAVNERLSVVTLVSVGSFAKCLPGGGSIDRSSTCAPLQQGVDSEAGKLRANSGPTRPSPANGKMRMPGGIGKPCPVVSGKFGCASKCAVIV